MSTPALPSVVVVAVDGSIEALSAARYTITLAKTARARVVALHVIHLPEYVSDETKSRLRSELGQVGERALSEVEAEAKREGVEIRKQTIDTSESVVDAICGFAATEGAGMVVLGTRGTGGVAKLLLGSVAVGVARSAKCPVLVVR